MPVNKKNKNPELTPQERQAACQVAVNTALDKFNCDIVPMTQIVANRVTSQCQIFPRQEGKTDMPAAGSKAPARKTPVKKNAPRK
jgi:hypothetical protein